MTPDQIGLLVGIAASVVTVLASLGGFLRFGHRVLSKRVNRAPAAPGNGKTATQAPPAEPPRPNPIGYDPFLDEYRRIWSSNSPLEQKIALTNQMLPAALHEIIVLDLGIEMDINAAGDTDIAWNYQLLNLSTHAISSDILKIWFNTPQRWEVVSFTAVDVDRNLQSEVRVIRDLPNFKQVVIGFPIPIAPLGTLNYRIQYRGLRECVEPSSYWWETEIVRLTNSATVRVALPPGTTVSHVRAVEVAANAEEVDKQAKLEVRTRRMPGDKSAVSQQIVQWEREFPTIGGIYKIFFPPAA